MEFATEKWGGIPHYRGTVVVLGEDEHGVWCWGEKGRTILRGDEPVFVAETDTLFLIPRDRWWSATWWWDHPEVELYVNVGTVAVFEPERIVSVDLDLDVIRRLDGTCEIIDQDEFEEHRAAYGSPPDVIQQAEVAAADLLDRLQRRIAPFDDATPRAWSARALSD